MLTELAPLWSPDTPVFENFKTSNLLPLVHTSAVLYASWSKLSGSLYIFSFCVIPAPTFQCLGTSHPTLFVSFFHWTLVRLIHSVFNLSFYSNPYFWFHPYPLLLKLTWGQILSPWLGDIVDYGIGLSYRPARLHITYVCLPVRQPYLCAIVDYFPKTGTKNLATGSWSDWKSIFA
jgi:hypothetical protein